MNSPVFYSASRSNIVPSCSILPSLSWVGTSCKYLLILCLCTVMVHSFCVCVFALWRESCLFAFFCDCLLWDLCFLARCKAMFLICVCLFVCLFALQFLFVLCQERCLDNNMQWGWPCAFHCCRLFQALWRKIDQSQAWRDASNDQNLPIYHYLGKFATSKCVIIHTCCSTGDKERIAKDRLGMILHFVEFCTKWDKRLFLETEHDQHRYWDTDKDQH